jgi:ribonuclease P protein subunit RPR2
MRLLLVDDDPGLMALLRTTFEVFDVELAEAANAEQARDEVRRRQPDAIVLDVAMPGLDGLGFCAALKRDPETRGIPVVLLTGEVDSTRATEAGADAHVRKPFSPLELLAVVERLTGQLHGIPYRLGRKSESDEQLQLYAHDLRHLLEIERGQRILLQKAYKETVAALASALETKDFGTSEHSQRVQRYASELMQRVAPELTHDPSVEYGFLLHDVGKIGIPDRILLKPQALSDQERRLMQTHTVLGEQMLGGVAFLQGEGLKIVRSHHERWQGDGYPDGLSGDEIPLGARIFAVADALDAITSHRPYRTARSWQEARDEIHDASGTQFDPTVVEAFRQAEPVLRRIGRELAA